MGERKQTFCESNKCTLVTCVFVLAAIAVVVCVTFLDKEVRDIYDHEKEHTGLEWWQTTIIYQIYPRSFQDSGDDGIGDLRGVISRLNYFNFLNVGAIWLSPFYKSPMKDFGYDVANYTEVDPIFGTMKDFEDLMKEAKDRNLKVIIDFVPNHTSNDSEWFQLSRRATDPSDPFYDFYIWNEGTIAGGERQPPNNWQSVFEGSAWKWDDVRQAYYYHAFLESQPDLNYRSMAVRKKINEVIRFWLDKGVDGLRIDAIPHLFEIADQSIDEPPGKSNGFNENLHKYTKNQPEIFDVVREWRAVLDEYEKRDGNSRFLLAETVGIPHHARMQYYEAGSVPFFFNLIPAKEKCGATAQCFFNIIKDGVNLTEGQWPNFVIGNHDNPRIAVRIGKNYVDALNMMLLLLPGTPTTYYGEELGMTGGDYTGMPPKDPYAITSNNPSNSRDSERNPMQWDTSANAGFTRGNQPWLQITPNTDSMHVNVEAEKNLSTSSLNLYKSLAKLRQQDAFQNAAILLPEAATHNVLVFVRGNSDTGRYVVALNLGKTSQSIDVTPIGYREGTVEFSTKLRGKQKINLTNINLDVGEGIVIHLDS